MIFTHPALLILTGYIEKTFSICHNDIVQTANINGGMKLKSNKKKNMVAPIVISVIIILYFVVYFGFLISLLDGLWKYVLSIFPLVFAAVMIKVCIERIQEIKKGVEDDIGKY